MENQDPIYHSHLSALELEELELEGLPSRRPNIVRKAHNEEWKFELRTPDGGGKPTRHFAVTSLPEDAVLDLLKRRQIAERESADGAPLFKRAHFIQRMRDRRGQESLEAYNQLPDWARDEVDAKAEFLDEWDQFQKAMRGGVMQLRARYVHLFNTRALAFSDDVYEAIGKVSVRSLQRWERLVREKGYAALASNHGRLSSRDTYRKIDSDPRMKALVEKMIKETPHVRASHVKSAMVATFGADEAPSLRTIQKYLRDWKREHANEYLYLCNPDAWKSKNQIALGNASENVTRLNQLWELDSTPADVILEGGRHAVLGVIDVYSRRAKIHVAKSSTAAGIAALLHRAMLDWGIPEEIKTDNGADYTSKHIQLVLAELGIRQHVCPPFSPEKKPFIERFFGTFSRGLLELRPDFIGHNVAQRRELEARDSFWKRLAKKGEPLEISSSVEEFQAFCDDWCDSVYATNPHSQLPKRRRPVEMVADWDIPIRRIENERALDILLSPVPGGDGVRTIRNGAVQVENVEYRNVILANHTGEEVRCYYDESNAGRLILRRNEDNTFLCVAENHALLGVTRQELAIAYRREQRVNTKRKVKELGAGESRSVEQIAWDIMESKKEERAKIHWKEPSSVPYSTDSIEAASEAADALSELDKPRELRKETPPEILTQMEHRRAEIEKDPLERPGDGLWSGAGGHDCFDWVKSLPEPIRYDGRVKEHEWMLVRKIDVVKMNRVDYQPIHPDLRAWREANPFARPWEKGGPSEGAAPSDGDLYEWAKSLPSDEREALIEDYEWNRLDAFVERTKGNRGRLPGPGMNVEPLRRTTLHKAANA